MNNLGRPHASEMCLSFLDYQLSSAMNKLSVEEYSHGHFLLAVATEGKRVMSPFPVRLQF
jgi:hypothetical protein